MSAEADLLFLLAIRKKKAVQLHPADFLSFSQTWQNHEETKGHHCCSRGVFLVLSSQQIIFMFRCNKKQTFKFSQKKVKLCKFAATVCMLVIVGRVLWVVARVLLSICDFCSNDRLHSESIWLSSGLKPLNVNRCTICIINDVSTNGATWITYWRNYYNIIII